MTFNGSLAQSGNGVMPFESLIIGQRITGSGTGVDDTIYPVSNADEVAAYAAPGSQAHRQAIAYFANNESVPCNLGILADASGAVKEVTTVTISGTATEDGVFSLYINGVLYDVAVATGDLTTDTTPLLSAKFTDLTEIPFDVTAPGGLLTLTAKNAGVAAGEIKVEMNRELGEATPAGLTVVIATATAGATDPDVQDIIDVIGDRWFNAITMPYSDSSNLTAMQTWLDAQNSVLVQKDSCLFVAKKDTRTNLITFSTNAARNSKFVSAMALEAIASPAQDVAAAYMGVTATGVSQDSAAPVHRKNLVGIVGLKTTEVPWTFLERNQLAVNGWSTMSLNNGPQTENTLTMYLKNSAGALDNAFRELNGLYIRMYQRYTFVQKILIKFPTAKLMDNADRVEAGQSIITPNIGKAVAIEWARDLESEGILENVDDFIKSVICRRSTSNKSRLEWIMYPDQVDTFKIGDATAFFK